MEKSQPIKILAFSLAVIFLFQQMTWAGGENVSVLSVTPHVSTDTSDIQIGSSGKQFYISPGIAQVDNINISSNGELVINIQDAHSSLSAQYSIASLLESLLENYDLRVIAIEGGRGYIDTSILKSVPDDGVRRTTAEYLMEEGIISAGEFFSALTSEDVAVYGAEENELYVENLELFRDVYSFNARNEAIIEGIRAYLSARERQVHKESLRRFLYRSGLHRQGKISFQVYWEFLEGFSVSEGIPVGGKSSIEHLKYIVALEKEIDFNRATIQRSALIERIIENSSLEELEDLVRISGMFEKNKIGQDQYHDRLVEMAENKGIDIAELKDLNRFVKYLRAYRSLDIIGLSNDIRRVEENILENLFSSREERELYRLSRAIDLIRRMFRVEMTPGEVDELDGILSVNGPENVLKQDPLMASREEARKLLGDAREAIRFYRLAEKRNHAMIAKTVDAMRMEGKKAAVLISGGHHSSGLTELMREKGLSYIVLMPRVSAENERPYVAVLTRKTGPYRQYAGSGDRYLALEALFDKGDLSGFVPLFVKMMSEMRKAGLDLGEQIEEMVKTYTGLQDSMPFQRKEARGFQPVSPVALEEYLKSARMSVTPSGDEVWTFKDGLYLVKDGNVAKISGVSEGGRPLRSEEASPAGVFTELRLWLQRLSVPALVAGMAFVVFSEQMGAYDPAEIFQEMPLNAVLPEWVKALFGAAAAPWVSAITHGKGISAGIVRSFYTRPVEISSSVKPGRFGRSVLRGLKNVDSSAYKTVFSPRRLKTDIEVEFPAPGGASRLLIDVYHDTVRAEYELQHASRDESVTADHKDDCPFCDIPGQQRVRIGGRDLINVNGNPYVAAININPYLKDHILIVSGRRDGQYLSQKKIVDILTFQRALGHDFSGHYNGINAGASVLHFHAQYRRQETPVWKNLRQGRISVKETGTEHPVKRGIIEGWPGKAEIFTGDDVEVLAKALWEQVDALRNSDIPHDLDWTMTPEGEISVILYRLSPHMDARNYFVGIGAVERSGYMVINNPAIMRLLVEDGDFRRTFAADVMKHIELTSLGGHEVPDVSARVIPRKKEIVSGDTLYIDENVQEGYIARQTKKRFHEIAVSELSRGRKIFPEGYDPGAELERSDVEVLGHTYSVVKAPWREEYVSLTMMERPFGVNTPHPPGPCRLCGLPAEERLFKVDVLGHEYDLFVNKNPFMPYHMMLVSYEPFSQDIGGKLTDIFFFMKALGPGFECFLSSSGPSNTLHFHFQIGRKKSVFFRQLDEGKLRKFRISSPESGVSKSLVSGWPMEVILFESEDPRAIQASLDNVLSEIKNRDVWYDILISLEDGTARVALVPLASPRPSEYMDRIDPSGYARLGGSEAGGDLVVTSEKMLNMVLEDKEAFVKALEKGSYRGILGKLKKQWRAKDLSEVKVKEMRRAFREMLTDIESSGKETLLISDMNATITEADMPVTADNLSVIIDVLARGDKFVILSGNSKQNVERQFLNAFMEVMSDDDSRIIKNLVIAASSGTQIYTYDEKSRDFVCTYSLDMKTELGDEKFDSMMDIIREVMHELNMRGMISELMGWDFTDDEWEAYRERCLDLREVNGSTTQVTVKFLTAQATYEEKKRFVEAQKSIYGDDAPCVRYRYEQAIQERLSEEGIEVEVKTSGLSSIDITLGGTDKGRGIEKIFQELGYSPEKFEVVYFGDAYEVNGNDETAMRSAGNLVNVGPFTDVTASAFFRPGTRMIQFPDSGSDGFGIFLRELLEYRRSEGPQDVTAAAEVRAESLPDPGRIPVNETGFYKAWEKIISGSRPSFSDISASARNSIMSSAEGIQILDSSEKIEREMDFVFYSLNDEERGSVFDFVMSLAATSGMENWTMRDYKRIYELRATTRNMFVASHVKKELPPSVKRVTRGIAYSMGLLAHLLERNILMSRIGGEFDISLGRVSGVDTMSPGETRAQDITERSYVKWLSGLQTYREVFQGKVTRPLEGVELEKIYPQGSQMVAFGADELPFVVKVVRDGAVNNQGMAVDFDRDIRKGVRLARERLGGLAANTMVIDNLSVNIAGRQITLENAVIQSRVVSFRQKLTELNNDPTRGADEAARLIRLWWDLQKEMWSRGVVDGDIKLFDNYGYDELSDRVVIFDFTNISDEQYGFWNEDHYQSNIDTYRIANRGVLRALGSEIKADEIYAKAEFEAMRDVEIKGRGSDITVSLWPSDDGSKEHLFVPLSDPLMVDSREFGRVEIILQRLLSEAGLFGLDPEGKFIPDLLFELEKHMLWMGADRLHGFSTGSMLSSAALMRDGFYGAPREGKEGEISFACPRWDRASFERKRSVTQQMVNAIEHILKDSPEYAAPGSDYYSIDSISLERIDRLPGRDVLTLSIRTPQGVDSLMVILYSAGYNLDASVNDPFVRPAYRLLDLYRNFRLVEMSGIIEKTGIKISKIEDVVRDVFRDNIIAQELSYFDSGGDAVVYVNPTGEVVVKDLAETDREILKRPVDAEEVEKGPSAGYRLAEKHLGHLVIRFMRVDDLAVRIRESDGTLRNKTIKRAIIQKKVPVFFKEGSYDFDRKGRSYTGILADAIEDGRISSAKMLMDEFLMSIRAMMSRGVFDWDVKTENYGYDITQGHMGSLDAGKFMKASLAESEHGRVFIRNLQAARDDIKAWTTTVQDEKTARELAAYFEKSVKKIFSESDFVLDISRDVRELEADEDFSEIVRWNFSRGIKGVPVCYTGTEEMRKEAASRIAEYIKGSDALQRLERVFAEIGLEKMITEKNRSTLITRPFIEGDSTYLTLNFSDYVGAKVRFSEKYPRGGEVLLKARYGEEKISSGDVKAVSKSMVRHLLHFYDHTQSYYSSLARAFGLDEKVDVTDRLSLQVELDKIDTGSLDFSQRAVLEILFGIKRYDSLKQDLGIVLDEMAAFTRYPFDITLDNFIVRREGSDYVVELDSLGSYIKKARENEIVRHMNEYLGIPYDIIFESIEEEKGLEKALVFFERVFYQEEAGSRLREYTRERIDHVLRRIGGVDRGKSWMLRVDVASGHTAPIVVGVPSEFYHELIKGDYMKGLIRNLGNMGVGAIVPIVNTEDPESMMEELSVNIKGKFIGAVLARDVFEGLSGDALVEEIRNIISDFSEKVRVDILRDIFRSSVKQYNLDEGKRHINSLEEIRYLAGLILRTMPGGMSYDISSKSVRDLSFDQIKLERKYQDLRNIGYGDVDYPRPSDNNRRHFFIHFAEAENLLQDPNVRVIPPGLEIMERRRLQGLSISREDPDTDKFFIVAPEGENKRQLRDNIMKLWMLNGVVSPENVVILDHREEKYQTSELFFMIGHRADSENTAFRTMGGVLEYDDLAGEMDFLQIDLRENSQSTFDQYMVLVKMLYAKEGGSEFIDVLPAGLKRTERGNFIYIRKESPIDFEVEVHRYYERYLREILIKA